MNLPVAESTDPSATLVNSDTTESTGANLADMARSGQMPIAELFTLGDQLQSMGHLQEASNLYALWLEHTAHEQKYAAYFNWGALLQKMGQFQEAVQVYRKALELNPQFLQAPINMGLTLEKMGQDSAALEAWAQVVARRYVVSGTDQELLATAFNHIGRLHENHRHYHLAEQALEQSLLINPKQPGVIQHWIHIRQKSCCWPVYRTLPNVTNSDLRQATSPLAMLALTDDPVAQLLCAQSFVKRVFDLTEEHLCGQADYQHAKVRVGYVSGDFKEHAVGFLLPAYLETHNRQQYELFAYDFASDDRSATRAHIFSQFDHVRSIHALTDREAAMQILADEIDILVDLHGLSAGARPGIFALHPAPKQATYLGFIGSTAMPWFDHVITDRQAMPAELCEYFVEKPLYVDGSFIPLIRSESDLPDISRSMLGIAEDAFLMAAFGNVYKITPEMFQCWARLLQRIPGALLWLIDDNPDTTRNLQQAARKAGLRPDQILFTARTGHPEFCARLGLADVYLDTYPYNCGSTSNDVIQAGIPLVTLSGRTMVSRMGLSILTAVGLQALATTSLPDYEAKVVEIWLRKKASLHPPQPVSHPVINANKALSQIHTDPTLNTLTPEPASHSQGAPARLLAYRFDHAPKAKPAVRDWVRLPVSENASQARAEFATLRQHLLATVDHQETAFMGYFSAEDQKLFGLEMPYARQFVEQCEADTDVILFSPGWDMSAFFINPFVQGDYFDPGTLAIFQEFASAQGLGVDLSNVVMHSENTCFENLWVAKRSFWLLWLEWTEKFVDWMRRNHPQLDPFAPHLQQRVVNLLLMRGEHRVVSHDIFKMQPTGSFLSQHLDLAIELNALKQSCATGTQEAAIQLYRKHTEAILNRTPLDLAARELTAHQLSALMP